MKYASLLLLLLMQLVDARRAGGAEKQPWASFVETNFPFFSSVVDARMFGSGLVPHDHERNGIRRQCLLHAARPRAV